MDLSQWYIKYIFNSHLKVLNSDPEQRKYYPNQTSREVKSGHYVSVKPTVLPNTSDLDVAA